jgi:hypothetical protein
MSLTNNAIAGKHTARNRARDRACDERHRAAEAWSSVSAP